MKNEKDTVVGIFLDEAHAQQAIQKLQSAGFQAQLGSGDQDFGSLTQEERGLFKSRASEGNAIVVVNNAGDRGEEALNFMLDSGAENVDMNANESGTGSGYSTASQSTSTSRGGSELDDSQRSSHYQNLQNLQSNQRQYGRIDQTTGKGKTADDIRVQLREEQLSATKTSNQAGEVQLHKVVHEKEQEIPVTLRHEEVTIERHAVDRPVEGGEITDLKDEVIRVPIYEEQAQLQKQGRVAEEVVIGKEVREEQQTLRGTTRHEHLEVEQQGDVRQVGGDANTTQDSTDYGNTTDTNYNQR